MAAPLPGRVLMIDREQDRTWRVEIFTELDTDYKLCIWRERVSYDAQGKVCMVERGNIAATVQDGGKPACIVTKLSNIVGSIGKAMPITADKQTFPLANIPMFVTLCNEAVATHNKEQRRLQAVVDDLAAKYQSKTITKEQYEAQLKLIQPQLDKLLPTT